MLRASRGVLARPRSGTAGASNLFEGMSRDAEAATSLSNLANLIQREVRAGRAPISRLREARALAEQGVTILRTLDASAKIWNTLSILASISEQEGDLDAVGRFRREERETFAAFPGHRLRIDEQFVALVTQLATAVDEEHSARVRVSLP